MKLIHCFIAVFLLLCSTSFAQRKFEYEVSKPYRVIDAPYKYYLSAKNRTTTLSVKIDGKDFYMQSFDTKTMKELKREKYSDMPKGFVVEGLFWVQDKVYCFYSLWDKPNKKEQLFAREIDFDNCQFKGQGKRILTVDGKLAGPPMFSVGIGVFYIRLQSTPKFDFLQSQDESKLLIQYRRVPEKKRDAVNHDVIGMHVFDTDLEKIAGGDIKMPYTEKKMDNIDYHVNNDGTPFILAKVRKDNSTKEAKGVGKNKKVNYTIELFKVDVESKKINITKISVENRFIKDIWLYDDPQNNMLCSGFYNGSEDKPFSPIGAVDYDNADGIFVFRVSEEGEITEKKFYEIPVEVLNQYVRKGEQKKNEKKNKKGKAEFSDLELRKLIVQDDNSILIIGEQHYIVAYTDSKGRTRYVYYYNDMLVTKIGADGELAWMRKLPKRQKGGAGRGGMGFQHMKIDDKHYFVYLDNVKNIDLKLDQRPAYHQDGLGGFLTAYEVDDEFGKVNKVSIFDTKEVKGDIKVYQFNTGRILEISDSEFVIEFYKKKKEDVMIKVNVE